MKSFFMKYFSSKITFFLSVTPSEPQQKFKNKAPLDYTEVLPKP